MFSPLFSTWGRRTSVGLIIFFSFLLLYSIWQMPVQLKKDKQLSLAVGKTEEQSTFKMDASLALIPKIPEAHLFGRAPQENGKNLPITSLQLRLIGVIASQSGKLSRIIISESGLPGKVYQIGDALGPVRVNAIAQDGVILEHNGRLEKLPLQRQALSFQGMPKKLLNEE